MVVYRSPLTDPVDQQAVESLAGMVFLTKDGREFTKLLEVSLEFLLGRYRFYGVFLENFPQCKTRLRSYRGLLPGEFLASLFSETVETSNLAHVDLLKCLARYTRPGTLLFDISRDGQSRIHLAFYGHPDDLTEAMNGLVLRLRESFYLRKRSRGFDYGRRKGAVGG